MFHVKRFRLPRVGRLIAGALILLSTLAGGAEPIATTSAASPPPQARINASATSPAFVPGVLLVKPRSGIGSGALRAQPGVQQIDRAILPNGVERIVVTRGQEQAVAARLRASGLVEYAQPDYIRRITDVTPNDPLYAEDQWDLPRIGMPAAWSTTEGSSGVIVAVIDTGYDFGHPDQPIHLIQGPVYSSLASMDNCGPEGPVPIDDDGHGTHVTGTIAAAFDNGQGVAGIAPNATIMVIKAADCVGNLADSDIILAINYATDHSARVINMSFGGTDADPALTDAVNDAWAHGVVLAAAAGNGGSDESFFPADIPNVLSVAATNGLDQPTWYSDWGDSVDVAAPGGDYGNDPGIWSTCVNLQTTPPSPTYCPMIGTSMASPHVAAEATLLLSVAPCLSNAQVSTDIKLAVDPIQDVPSGQSYGSGRIDVNTALNLVLSKTDDGVPVSPCSILYFPLLPNAAPLTR